MFSIIRCILKCSIGCVCEYWVLFWPRLNNILEQWTKSWKFGRIYSEITHLRTKTWKENNTVVVQETIIIKDNVVGQSTITTRSCTSETVLVNYMTNQSGRMLKYNTTDKLKTCMFSRRSACINPRLPYKAES